MTDSPLKALPFQVIDYPEGVILKRGFRQVIVNGTGALQKVLIILTSTSGKTATKNEICDAFSVSHRESVANLVDELLQKKFLINASLDASQTSENSSDIFYEEFGLKQQEVCKKLSALHLLLVGVNSLNKSIFNSLTELGVQNITIIDDPLLRNQFFFDANGQLLGDININFRDKIIGMNDFESHFQKSQPRCVLASSDFGGQALLLRWNQFCIQNNLHFLPAYLHDMVGYLGPLVIPGETACLTCLRSRQNSNLQQVDIRALIEKNSSSGQSIYAIHPSAIQVLAQTAVFELTHFFGDMPFPRPGHLLRIDLLSGNTGSKFVLKVPRCPSCSKLLQVSEIQLNKMHPML